MCYDVRDKMSYMISFFLCVATTANALNILLTSIIPRMQLRPNTYVMACHANEKKIVKFPFWVTSHTSNESEMQKMKIKSHREQMPQKLRLPSGDCKTLSQDHFMPNKINVCFIGMTAEWNEKATEAYRLIQV